MRKIFKKSKQIIAAIACLATSITLIPPSIAQALVINSGEDTGYEITWHPEEAELGKGTHIKHDEYGNVVYCMNSMKNSPPSIDFDEGELLDDVAYRILKNGYPNKSFTGDDKKDFMITQTAFWAYVNRPYVLETAFLREKGTLYADMEMTNYFRELYWDSINESDTQTISINFSQIDLEAKFDGENYVTDYFTVNVTGAIEEAKFQMKMKTEVDGVRYQLESGDYVEEVPMNTNFRVVVPKNAKQGEVKIGARGQIKGARVVAYKSPRNDVQDIAKWTEYEVHENSVDYANITWNTKGNFELTKTNDLGELIDGAKFALNNINDGSIVAEAITKNGKIRFENIESGFYDLVELEPAPGYINNFKTKRIEVLPSNSTTKENVQNETIKGKVKITKTDIETGEKLVGAEFELKEKSSGKVVEKLVTGSDGTATSGLHRFGEYVLKETKAPHKYTLNEQEYPVTISKHLETIEITHKNKIIKGKIEINKEDGEIPGLKLEGIKFGIFDSKNTLIEELTTDKKGHALSKLLNWGDYTIRELKTKEGYVLNNNEWKVEIREDNKTLTYNIKNERIKGKLKLIKVDQENNKITLPGVKFKITCTDGFMKGKEWTETTDKNGEINLKDLQYGKYVAEEITPLWNYIRNNKKIKFEITENGKTIELKVQNKKIRGSVEIIKLDKDTKRPLEGAEFELYNGEKLISKYTTNKDGKIVVENLEAGKYYFKEVKAPNNYIVNDEDKLYFSILENKQIVKLSITNKVKEGGVDFSKTDVTTGDLIEGAKITITGLEDHNNHIKFEFVSSKEGNKFKLPVGKYEFKEILAPEGYVLNEEIGTFEIKEKEVVKAELKNKRISGTLDFSKTDVSTGKLIDGANIKIECIEGFNKGKVIEFISSSQGNRFELEYGKYKFYETTAPEGYELSTEVGEFEIKENGEIVKAELKNKKIPVEVPKTGDDSLRLLISIAVLSIAALAVISRKKASK